MYKRWQEENIKSALTKRRVVILAGARQCGKTTLSKTIFKNYRTLDDFALYDAAKNDPKLFVKNPSNDTMVIDEIQKVPELVTAIKQVVDDDNRYGQYLITGSVNIQNLPTVKESLAGRVKKVRLRPLSQAEIEGRSTNFLNRISTLNFIQNKKYDKENISELIFKGGYPEALSINNEKERKSWFNDYINTILENDLKVIANIKRQDYLKDLFSIIASFSSKFIDKSKIAPSLGVVNQTLNSYLAILENTYLVDRLSPWLKSDYERVNKQPKFFITDTGLMGAVLGWNFKDLFLDQDKSGKVFETFVYNELMAEIEIKDEEYKLHHYRDRNNHEIDFIIEAPQDTIYGIEVKSGSSMSRDYFKHLKWFKEHLAKEKKFIGIVLYTGEHVIEFYENMFAVPMNNLWE